MSYLNRISILLSLVCIVTVLIINYFLAIELQGADGVMKTLLAIALAFSFGYKYVFISLGMVAFILAIVSFLKNIELKSFAIAAVLSIVSMALTFIDSWKIWIKLF